MTGAATDPPGCRAVPDLRSNASRAQHPRAYLAGTLTKFAIYQDFHASVADLGGRGPGLTGGIFGSGETTQ
jgi:hypothetical protein